MRVAAAIVTTLPFALLAVGCGGSSRSPVAQLGATTTLLGATTTLSSPSSTTQHGGVVAFARCMRTHGVSNWPDPTSSGVFQKSKLTLQQLGISGSRLQAAQSACRQLLPNGGVPTQAQLRQARVQALRFSRCIRSHGLPNFPDPGSDGRIPDPASVGIDQGSPGFQSANTACRSHRPPYIPSNAAYDTWAKSQG